MSNNKEESKTKESLRFFLRSSYHQKALQQIRNSLQPFATPSSVSTESLVSNSSDYRAPPPPPPSAASSVSGSPRQSPNVVEQQRRQNNNRGIEYRAQQYPFVPSQVPPSVQQLLRRIDTLPPPPPSNPPSTNPTPTPPPPQPPNYIRLSPSTSTTSSTSTSPLSHLHTKPPQIIKSTAVQKPVLQKANVLTEEAASPPPPPLPPKKKVSSTKHTHESPIPERKKLSREMEVERLEGKVRVYSPQAFKFFMEQHVENVIKSHQERLHRRMQLESEMAKIGLSEEAQTQMRRMLSQKESNYIRLKRAKMDKSMFKVIRTIGVGAFGEVSLVQKLDSQPRSLYAMKTLRKSDVLRRNQVAHVKAERDILAEADNEWVVKLYYSFQDMDNLYFVMDYIPGGDLMSLLIKKEIFEEELARFYIAELTMAIESVHRMGFIHRDIKPDNILIDRDGHIKLTDFGLCTGFRWTHNSKYYNTNCDCAMEDSGKLLLPCSCRGNQTVKPLETRKNKNLRCLAHSLVGTPNYIAPEVLMRIGYSQLCDWWSVGVILYEMLVGRPPFVANSPAETQFKVINWERTLRVPEVGVSPEAKDLILKLCTGHEARLGGGPGKAGEIKSHPFFAQIDFSQPNLRRTIAPYIPKIAHSTDTSNFESFDAVADRTDVNMNNDSQFHGFYEFTFRRFFDDAYNEKFDTMGTSGGGGKNSGGPVYV